MTKVCEDTKHSENIENETENSRDTLDKVI